ncbi:translation initiation factor eIF-2B subunit epsilon-like [Dreissena polymorpha]|uniref:translation initiation factor eIF-2B subunit epsilon-like n=1 Tax=Dreissena polymorpha TaxID=45954 RepID=UPI002264BD92|nr:translation initiation factor eIF-2B subunit epsilon-like [Dreissena polymorpha]
MAPKGKSGGANSDLKQEDILQAVVFADSFVSTFAPVSDDIPRALFPVANSALLDYALEFLCSGGVQEIFVVCCHLAGQVREHLKNSRWNDKSSPCNVVPVVTEGCLSMGDALRDIDAKSLIRSDFVLIYGDVVSNIKLQPIIDEHKNRREKDKSAIMTMVFREVPPGHATRCPQDDIVLAVDNETQNVIHYQRIADSDTKHLQFPVEVIMEHKDVQIRYDLLDANISICSPQVPQLFTDNFDYETRDSFVKGILINEEIMGNTIKMCVVKDAYAARVSSLQMYDAVSQDILNRWTYPFVPDGCHRHNKDNFSYGRHNIYLSKNVTLARDCMLVENVMLGRESAVGSKTTISHSVIGKNCKIGNNVVIKGSYLWNDVTVEDNCVIETSLLCNNVTVYSGVKLSPGCVLSSKVCVGPSIELKSGTVVVHSQEDDFGEGTMDATDGGCDAMFGSKGKAFLYKDTSGDDSDVEEVTRQVWGITIETESSSDEDSECSEGSESPPDSLQPDVPVYYTEMLDTVQRSKDENISCENLILEINSLKHAYNISIKELTGLVVKVLLDQPFSENPSLSGAQALKVLTDSLKRHLMVLKNYIKNEESQRQCLEAIEDFASASSAHLQLVTKVIHFLYEADVLLEQTILKWYRQVPSNRNRGNNSDDEDLEDRDNKHAEVRKQVAPLIKWLEEADEESSEED